MFINYKIRKPIKRKNPQKFYSKTYLVKRKTVVTMEHFDVNEHFKEYYFV